MNIYLNKPTINKDVVVFEGDTYTFNYVLFDDCTSSGVLIDVTGWTFELAIRDRFNNLKASIVSIGTSTGVDLSLTSIITTMYPTDSYRYSIRYITNTLPTTVKTIQVGNFIIKNAQNII